MRADSAGSLQRSLSPLAEPRRRSRAGVEEGKGRKKSKWEAGTGG